MWKFLCIGCLFFFLSSCGMQRQQDERKDDASETMIFRYDKLLNDYVAYNSLSALQRLTGEYREHTRILVEEVLKVASVDDEDCNRKLQAIYSDSLLSRLTHDVLEKYDQMDEYEQQFHKAFSNMQKMLPGLQRPVLYAQISALNESIVVQDSLVGISLDKYMGSDYPLYEHFFHEYQRGGLRPDRMLPDVIKFYLIAAYPFPEDQPRTLLNQMIYLGKIYHVARNILDLPSADEMLGYREERVEWCKNNNAAIWTFMQDKDHLQSTDHYLLVNYLERVPFNEFFGKESPSKLGLWLGMKIVESYMDKHPSVSFETLLNKSDYADFLANSGYNPK